MMATSRRLRAHASIAVLSALACGCGAGSSNAGGDGSGGVSSDATTNASLDGAVADLSDSSGTTREDANRDVGIADESAADSSTPAQDARLDDSATDTFAPDTAAPDTGAPRCAPVTGRLSPTTLSVRFADSIMARWPDARNIGGTAHGWDYNVGIALQGIERVYERTGDSRYVTYIQQYVDRFVDSAGAISGLPAIPAGYALDTIEPGTMVLFLYRQTALAKYQTAAQALLQILSGAYPRNASGGFWHKQQYPNQMWLDGIYMAEPFVAQYGTLFSTCGSFCVDTPVQQTALIAPHTLDTASGLFYHGWDATMMAAWANPATGRSPNIWSRGMGWFAMALVDVLRFLPAGDPNRLQFIQWLAGMATGIKSTQDAATGLWYQVTDMAPAAGNFIETSGSGMFVYALKVAVDQCYIDPSYLAVAQRGWAGIQAEVQTDAMGPVITNAVQGMGVQNNYGAYVNQARLSNSGHGLCGVLMAGSQME
jgi:unsaturated rhamnogalacturonyl hydrolase